MSNINMKLISKGNHTVQIHNLCGNINKKNSELQLHNQYMRITLFVYNTEY